MVSQFPEQAANDGVNIFSAWDRGRRASTYESQQESYHIPYLGEDSNHNQGRSGNGGCLTINSVETLTQIITGCFVPIPHKGCVGKRLLKSQPAGNGVT